jgi:hypothetical protein
MGGGGGDCWVFDDLGAHPTSYPMGMGHLSPWVKAAGT